MKTRYLLSSIAPFRLSERVIIELYKRGSEFVTVDWPYTLDEVEKEMREFDSVTSMVEYLSRDNLVIYEGHILGFRGRSLAARSCPILLQIVDEIGIDNIDHRYTPMADRPSFGIVEIDDDIKIEFCEGDSGHSYSGDYIRECHRSWYISSEIGDDDDT